MAILLTGGTGKTSTRLAKLLQDAGIPFLLVSRRAETAASSGMPAVNFDWLDESTFDGPFQYSFPSGERMTAVYLIAPEISDPVPSMNAFIDVAAEKHGVKRFVLLCGTSIEKGGYNTGRVWQHLADKKIEYCVLRATWFMENFTQREHYSTIKGEGKIYTACGEGKIPFISAGDIAAVAFHALTDVKSHDTAYSILGPELLTYDEVGRQRLIIRPIMIETDADQTGKVATKFSRRLGRHIEHVRQSEAERVKKYQELGVPENRAKLLSMLEIGTAQGMGNWINDDVERVVDRRPQNLDSWIQENKMAWQ
ncbi:MAG: hypothetical protein Q9210_004555 [Variospora velana]